MKCEEDRSLCGRECMRVYEHLTMDKVCGAVYPLHKIIVAKARFLRFFDKRWKRSKPFVSIYLETKRRHL